MKYLASTQVEFCSAIFAFFVDRKTKISFKEFVIGATIKYLRGLSTGEMAEAAGSRMTTYEGIFGDGYALVRRASGGNGAALDLGAAAVVNRKLSLGLSLRNFPGLINWSGNAKVNEYGVTARSLTAEQWASSHEDSVIQHGSVERTIAGFSRHLSMVVHVGAAYDRGTISRRFCGRNLGRAIADSGQRHRFRVWNAAAT